MENKIKYLAMTSALIMFSFNVFSDADEHHHQHDAHVHGAAVLNIVAEDKTILIELETPAMNILGFEHAPKTEEQYNIVKQANDKLKTYLGVLSLPNRQCEQTESDLEFAHDTHEAGHHHHEHDDAHSEYHLSYIINCASLDNLKLNIALFENFSGFEHVDLNWIYDQRQGAIELDPESTLIEF